MEHKVEVGHPNQLVFEQHLLYVLAHKYIDHIEYDGNPEDEQVNEDELVVWEGKYHHHLQDYCVDENHHVQGKFLV